MEGVLVIKHVSVKLFGFFNGGSIGDQERVCQTLQLLQWREYWWSKRVCPILQLLQRREYWWWRTCLSNSSASSREGVLVMKNVSVKLFSFFCGGSIGDQERVCQSLQFHQWRDYWWLRTCLSNSSASSLEGVLVIKTCLPNVTASSTEGVLVMKSVSFKLFSFFSGGCIGDQECTSQTLQLLQWRVYWWSRTCLSNSSASSMEGVLVIKNVSVKLFSFFSGGIIGDQERVCQNFSFINGGSIGDQARVCQTLRLL